MSTLRVNTLQNASGVEVYTAKAWVNFNGQGTVAIRASGNVSSITDNGAGDFTVNFTTAMADANYCIQGSGIGASNGGASVQLHSSGTAAAPTLMSASQFRIYSIAGGGLNDSHQLHVSVFR